MAALVAGQVALAGCSGLGAEAERVAAGLLGLPARSLQACLGNAPLLELREDGSEIWGYALPAPAESGNVEISRAVGQGTAFQRPRVEAGNPIERDAGDQSIALERRRAGNGQCLHVFRVSDGIVQTYTSKGRTLSGLNADAICTAELAHCVPEPTPVPEANGP